MEKFKIDTDLFIAEVEKRPVIWDTTSEEYSNKRNKEQAWKEIALVFSDSGATDDDRKLIGLKLQTKWKGLRDHYMRELKKCKCVQPVPGRPMRPTFNYLNKLRFLRTTFGPMDPVRTMSTEDEDLNMSSFPGTNRAFRSPNVAEPIQARNIRKLLPQNERHVYMLEQSLNQNQLENNPGDDEDKLFCLSLINEIKKVPEAQRLKLKIDIYNLILQSQMEQLLPVPSIINAEPQPSTSNQDTLTKPDYTTVPYNSLSPILGLEATPSPAYTSTSDFSQESQLDFHL